MDEFLKSNSGWDADAVTDPAAWKWIKRGLLGLVVAALTWVVIAVIADLREKAAELERIEAAAEARTAEWKALGMDPHIERLLERVTALDIQDDELERQSWALIDDLRAFDTQFRGSGWKNKPRQVGLVIDDPHVMYEELQKRTDALVERYRLLQQRAEIINQIEELTWD